MSAEKQFLKIQLRRGNEADFVTSNIILSSGEPAYALDTQVLKVGDGVNSWNNLNSALSNNVSGIVGSYISNINTSITTGISNVTITNGSGVIDYDATKKIQNITSNDSALFIVKGSGWQTSNEYTSSQVLCRINTTHPSGTNISWNLVSEWYNEPPSILPSGTHLILLQSIKTPEIQNNFIFGRYLNSKIVPSQSVNTSLVYLKFDGPEGSSTFIDSSSSNHTVRQGSSQSPAIHSTTAKYNGVSSVLFTNLYGGRKSLIIDEISDDFLFGTNNFTISFWFYALSTAANYLGSPTLLSSGHGSYATGNNGSVECLFDALSYDREKIIMSLNGGEILLKSKFLLYNTWNHVLLQRQGNTLTLSTNNTIDQTENVSGVSFDFGGNNALIRLGASQIYGGSAHQFHGFIDEFMIYT
jgi:hypothetical protein